MRAITTLAALLLPAALIALPAGPAAADCAQIDATIKAALSAKNTGEYEALYKTMSEDPSCDATYRDQVGRTMARSMLTTLTTDSDPQTIDATTTRYGRPWQVLVAIGDAYYERKDWANAVKVYEEALDDMRDIAANPTAPPADVEKRTYKRAVEARALAPIFVATRQFRGQKTGLASPNFRNFTAEAVPVPVQFEYDSDVLTENGIAAVTDIFAYVTDASPQHLVITGYTDPRGSVYPVITRCSGAASLT
jgi:outer membrane protein OmpA-like peptidoglycan-associated protein